MDQQLIIKNHVEILEKLKGFNHSEMRIEDVVLHENTSYF